MMKLNRKIAMTGACIGAGVFLAAWMWGLGDAKKPGGVPEPANVSHPQEFSGSFAEWMQHPDESGLQEGIRLAKVRGERMRGLIRTNPERAIREALSLSEWAALPPEIQAYVEEPFSAVADVEVIIACGEGFSETGMTTQFKNLDRMETWVYGRRNGVGSKNGAPVGGIRLGNLGALRPEIFQPLNAADEAAALALYPVAMPTSTGDAVAALAGGRVFYFQSRAELDEANARLAALEELPGPDAGAQALFEALEAEGAIDFQALETTAYAASTEWTGTPRDMYVILVDFSDLPGQPTDPVALSNSVNTAVSQQLWEMSYEKTHIVCTVNPTTFRMDDLSTAYVDTLSSYPNANRMHSNATAAVEATGVDLSPYETVCVLFADIGGITYAGLGNVGGRNLWLKAPASVKTIVHELGHNYGAKHANAWEVTGSDPIDPAGTEISYGDFTDIMGGGRMPSGHFNAFHKKRLNWLDADQWLSVATSGTYRVYRSDHRLTTGQLRGLEIDKGATDQYWVGLRQQLPSYETFSRGAYLLWKQAVDNESLLLDTTPTSAAGKYDGGLALGQTYSDAAAGVHITPVARGGQTPNEWMDITVNLGGFPGNTAPTATLSGPTNLNVRTSALFSVAATDADGDELAYAWDFGDGLVKPNTPALAAAWISGATATVSCVVSDMKGGTTQVSQSVVLSASLDTWTQRTSGTTMDLHDVAIGNGRIVAVGKRGTTAYSDDGINWITHTDGSMLLGNVFFEGIAYDGSQFIAVGMNYSGGWEMAIFTSADGTYWTKRYGSNSGSSLNITLGDVAIGGGNYVAVGDGGAILRSTNGINWSSVASGTTTNLRGVAYGDGVFVAVGAEANANNYVVLTSSNGVSWVNRTSGVDLASWKGLFDVEYCADRFLTGGFYARILGSTDQGQTFGTTMIGDRPRITSFAYGAGVYFAAGSNWDNNKARINLISLDGANWTESPVVPQTNRNAVVFFNSTFITVGADGSIWQSGPVGSSEPGFAVWQLENAAALGFDRDALDDADFDGHLNLAEYALGSSPTDPTSLRSLGTKVDAGGYFQMSVERNGIKADIDYLVERSANLLSNTWSTAETVIVTDLSTNLTVRSALPISGQEKEFLRLNLKLK